MVGEHRRSELEPPTCDDSLLWDVMLSAYHYPTLMAGDELGLFALLAHRPATAAEVSDALSLGPRATEALLALLTALGFLSQTQGRFHLTDVSRTYLLPESPFYWGSMFRFDRNLPTAFADILDALRRDRPPLYGGEDIWEAHELNPEQALLFTEAMHCHSLPAALALARHGDFEGVHGLLDVGGGSGCYCIALALRHPDMRFTVVELPAVAEIARRYVAEFGLEERIEVEELDMFADSWPTGHDAVLFSDAYHDWDRDRCLILTERSFESLPPGGRIYLHEVLLADARDGSLCAAGLGMTMLAATRGKQYTAQELDDILRSCGFRQVSVSHEHGYWSMVCARKP